MHVTSFKLKKIKESVPCVFQSCVTKIEFYYCQRFSV